MKKINLFLILFLLCLFGSACTEKFEGEMNAPDKINNPFVVSKDLACQIASSLYGQSGSMLRSTQGLQTSAIANCMSITNVNTDPIMYVINYEDDGFVVIAGDNRLEPILAYSETGNFPSVNESDLPYGLSLWIQQQEAVIDFYDDNNLEQMNEVKYLWDELMRKENTSTKAVDPVPPCQEGDTEILSDVGPFLETEWDQGSPYNTLFPVINCDYYSIHAYVGCLPLAMGQIARFHEYPTTYQWSNSPTTDMQRLLYDIYNLIDEDEGITSMDCSGTGVEYGYRVDLFFKNHFGYSSGSQNNYNSQTVKDILEGENPVIVIGDGHAWIYDGCKSWNSCVSDGQMIGFLQFHVNWGWGGDYNGWYNSQYVNVSGTDHYPDYYVYVYP